MFGGRNGYALYDNKRLLISFSLMLWSISVH